MTETTIIKNTTVCCADNYISKTQLIKIESNYTKGFAALQLIGNAAEVCKDGKERARAALEFLQFSLPAKKVVMSMTPAGLKKQGSHFDLPMAISLALLIRSDVPRICPQNWIFAAELGLSGKLRPVKGVLSFVLTALKENIEGVIIAQENLQEALKFYQLNNKFNSKLNIVGFTTLADVLDYIYKAPAVEQEVVQITKNKTVAVHHIFNFDDMLLSKELQKVALLIASGLHSALFRGVPGTGKSMFAQRLPSIFPTMRTNEHIETLLINSSICEKLPQSLLGGVPPFRSPHHQASAAAVLGNAFAPGEISLAHGGVMFLDELPEFRRDLLESLREPLETGEIRVSRSKVKRHWPAKFLLLAACNNCPCGWYGSTTKLCTCGASRWAYIRKLSGPILDRIDLHVTFKESYLNSADLFVDLAEKNKSSITKELKDKVVAVRDFAKQRNKDFNLDFNSELKAEHLISAFGHSAAEFSSLVNSVIPKSNSTRSTIRTLRVARTCADLDFQDKVSLQHLKYAISLQSEEFT